MFEKNIKAQIDAGVNGVILGGTLGEASTLTKDELEVFIKTTLKIVDGKIPVIVNIAEQSTKDGINLATRVEKLGGNGLMLLPPMRYKATDHEKVVYFTEIAKSTSLPIMIYNNPIDYKIVVTLDMFEEMLKLENIEAVKESTWDNVTRIKNRFGNRLKVLCGVDTLALESIVAGADGWVAGLGVEDPAETAPIYKLAKAGRVAEAIEIYRWFMPLLEFDISPQLVQNIKLAEVVTGLWTEKVRAPRLFLHGKERERVQSIIDTAMKNRPVLPAYKNI